MITHKECRTALGGCGQIKLVEEFGIDVKNRDGRRNLCKICANARRRAAYKVKGPQAARDQPASSPRPAP